MKFVSTTILGIIFYFISGHFTRNYFAYYGNSWKILNPVFRLSDYLNAGLNQAAIIIGFVLSVCFILSYLIISLLFVFIRKIKCFRRRPADAGR